MQIKNYPYVEVAEMTGDVIRDIETMYIRNNKHKIWKHVCMVAESCVEIAELYDLNSDVCKLAAYLHDISAIIKPADMLDFMKSTKESIDFAEEQYPFLLHQRISRAIAVSHFKITDEHVLSAINNHTTLRKNPTPYDMVIFIADKLSWDQSGEPPYYGIVKDRLSHSLESGCLAYIDYVLSNGMILCPHTWLLEGQTYLKNKIKNEDLA